jgi:CRP/FNR family cyclic AMP-dependent transcriptional regulator
MNGTQDMRNKWLAFLDGLRVVSYKKGQILFFQGEAPQSAYVVKSGLVKTYDLSSAGYEQLVYLNTLDDMFPLPWLTNQSPTATYYYEALTACELYRFTKDDYLDLIKGDPALLFRELERFGSHERSLTTRLSAVLHSKASDKLIHTLDYLVKFYGVKIDDETVMIDLKLTQQDLANLTGLRRETIAVEINKLKTAGVVSYGDHNSYYVNLKLLDSQLNNKFIKGK